MGPRNGRATLDMRRQKTRQFCRHLEGTLAWNNETPFQRWNPRVFERWTGGYYGSFLAVVLGRTPFSVGRTTSDLKQKRRQLRDRRKRRQTEGYDVATRLRDVIRAVIDVSSLYRPGKDAHLGSGTDERESLPDFEGEQQRRKGFGIFTQDAAVNCGRCARL